MVMQICPTKAKDKNAVHGEKNSKKGEYLLCTRNEVRYGSIQAQKNHYPVAMCFVG